MSAWELIAEKIGGSGHAERKRRDERRDERRDWLERCTTEHVKRVKASRTKARGEYYRGVESNINSGFAQHTAAGFRELEAIYDRRLERIEQAKYMRSIYDSNDLYTSQPIVLGVHIHVPNAETPRSAETYQSLGNDTTHNISAETRPSSSNGTTSNIGAESNANIGAETGSQSSSNDKDTDDAEDGYILIWPGPRRQVRTYTQHGLHLARAEHWARQVARIKKAKQERLEERADIVESSKETVQATSECFIPGSASPPTSSLSSDEPSPVDILSSRTSRQSSKHSDDVGTSHHLPQVSGSLNSDDEMQPYMTQGCADLLEIDKLLSQAKHEQENSERLVKMNQEIHTGDQPPFIARALFNCGRAEEDYAPISEAELADIHEASTQNESRRQHQQEQHLWLKLPFEDYPVNRQRRCQTSDAQHFFQRAFTTRDQSGREHIRPSQVLPQDENDSENAIGSETSSTNESSDASFDNFNWDMPLTPRATLTTERISRRNNHEEAIARAQQMAHLEAAIQAAAAARLAQAEEAEVQHARRVHFGDLPVPSVRDPRRFAGLTIGEERQKRSDEWNFARMDAQRMWNTVNPPKHVAPVDSTLARRGYAMKHDSDGNMGFSWNGMEEDAIQDALRRRAVLPSVVPEVEPYDGERRTAYTKDELEKQDGFYNWERRAENARVERRGRKSDIPLELMVVE